MTTNNEIEKIKSLFSNLKIKEKNIITKENENQPPVFLTEDLKEFGNTEKSNIHKEKTRNRNQPFAFLGGGTFGESLTLDMFPETIGSASKGGMAFDNKTLNEKKEIDSAKEVKFICLVGTKKCKVKECRQKCPPFQKKCIYCNGTDFEYMKDSRAGISSSAHIQYKDKLQEYIIYVQDYNDTTKNISIKAYKFLSKNKYFDNYIQNQYNSGNTKGGTCNFIPYSYDWFLSGPITIMDVDIDITTNEPKVMYNLYNPRSVCYDKVPILQFKRILKSTELQKLDESVINNKYCEYKNIVSIFTIRNKCIGKSRGTVSRR